MVIVIHCNSIEPVWTAEEIYTFIWKKGVRFILHFYAGRKCAGISLEDCGFFTLLYLLQAGIMNFNGKCTCELIYPVNADMNFTEFLSTYHILFER